MSTAQYMADVFRRYGVVDPERLAAALAAAERERNGSLLDVLVREGMDEAPLSSALADEMGLEFWPDLPKTEHLPVALLRDMRFDFTFARQRQVVPIREGDNAPREVKLTPFRFPTEDQAARYMRDVRRIHRASGQSDKPRRESVAIPV